MVFICDSFLGCVYLRDDLSGCDEFLSTLHIVVIFL